MKYRWIRKGRITETGDSQLEGSKGGKEANWIEVSKSNQEIE